MGVSLCCAQVCVTLLILFRVPRTVRMSAPDCRRWVANEWHKVWGVTCFAICAFFAACLTAFCRAVSSIWWRRRKVVSRSFDNCLEGNKYCHLISFAAEEYLILNRCGNQTPWKSEWWQSADKYYWTKTICWRKLGINSSAKVTTLCLPPFPLHTRKIKVSGPGRDHT